MRELPVSSNELVPCDVSRDVAGKNRMIRMSEPETRSVESVPPGGAESDARLVEDVRHGDHDAFEVLVRRYEGRLMSVLLRFVPDRELTRDLAQETFLRVYERLDQFD